MLNGVGTRLTGVVDWGRKEEVSRVSREGRVGTKVPHNEMWERSVSGGSTVRNRKKGEWVY